MLILGIETSCDETAAAIVTDKGGMLIVIDPPTISRSKSMDQMFDVQIDYAMLIQKALKLLLPDGVIVFSTNSRRFVFDEGLFPGCTIREISKRTLPIDFQDPLIHRCWKISNALVS